jgi:hypothetical protein
MDSLCVDLQYLTSTYLSGVDLVNLIDNHDVLGPRYLADWKFWHQRSSTDFSQLNIDIKGSSSKDTFKQYGLTPTQAYLNRDKLREVYYYHREDIRLEVDRQKIQHQINGFFSDPQHPPFPSTPLIREVSSVYSSLKDLLKEIDHLKQQVRDAFTRLLREIISGKIGQVVNLAILHYLFIEMEAVVICPNFNDLWSELFPRLALSLETELAIRLFHFIANQVERDEFINLLGSLGDFDDLIREQDLGSIYLTNLIRRFQHDVDNLKRISDYYDQLDEDTRWCLAGHPSSIFNPMASDLIALLK